MKRQKILVHTDLFTDFLIYPGEGEPDLRRMARKFFCYTTVFNAIELFSLARTRREIEAVENSMSAVKILGLNARSAPVYGRMLRMDRRLPRMNLLIAGLAIESKLPIATRRPEEFQGIGGLKIIHPDKVRNS